VTQSKSLVQSFVFAVLLPILLVGGGIGIFIGMGAQQPKQVAKDGIDPTTKLSKLSIVGVKRTKSYEGLKSLDVEVMGTVVPFRQVTVASEVAGRIKFKSQDCRIGKYVHKGDLLFKVDPTDFELEVERLAAMRESEYAQQKELDQELSNARRSLEIANEDVELQEKDIKRLESLPTGFASATELDQAKKLRITSRNQQVTVQNQLQLLETKRTRIVLAERLASAQLEQAKVNLDRCEVKSPISGVIITESVQEDSFVQKGASLCVIDDTDQVEVSCNLRADQLLLVLDQNGSDGSTAPVSSRVVRSSSYELPKTPVVVSYRVAGRENTVYQWHGHLSRYEGIGLDAQSRTVPIRVSVNSPEEVWINGTKIDEAANGGLPALVRGMFVDCAIQTKPSQSLVLLPKLALKPGNQVWQFVEDAAVLQPTNEELSLNTSREVEATKTQENQKETKSSLPKLKLEDWTAGRVRILRDIKVISTIRLPEQPDQEYWITESRPELVAGTYTVVTPLANMIGDGSDKARFQRASQGTE
jgi:multidrug efflux pump subunit AcrA (membrane-fusion protein)